MTPSRPTIVLCRRCGRDTLEGVGPCLVCGTARPDDPVFVIDPAAWCVVCCKPLADERQREFPDGCVAHERCFVDAPYNEIESHMTRRARGDS